MSIQFRNNCVPLQFFKEKSFQIDQLSELHVKFSFSYYKVLFHCHTLRPIRKLQMEVESNVWFKSVQPYILDIKSRLSSFLIYNTGKLSTWKVGLGGLGVTCSPWDPRFASSNPAEVDGFFQDVKILSTSPTGGTLNWGPRVWDFRLVKEPHTWKKNRHLSKI